jgi:hypothetical protein
MTEQTTTEQNLTEMTPVEIDTALYALYVETKQAEQRASWAWDRVKTVASKYLKKGWKDSLYVGEVREVMTLAREAAEAGQIETMVEDESLDIRVRGYRLQEVLEAAQAHEVATGAVKALEAAQQPYNDEWERRGRWTRAFIVTNANGHVHRSMHCSTCFPTTRYHWLTEMSDHDEAEIVEKAGQDACTVCYPSAPVESSTKPRQFFTPDEEAKAKARDERAAKAAERKAAEVTVEGYRGYNGRIETKVFKSVRAVTNDIAGNLGSLCWYGETHPSAQGWLANVEACRKALADKGVDYDYDKALASARKRVTREGGTPRY